MFVSASAAATAARFSEAAPCEPPNTSSVGPVGVQPEGGPGLGAQARPVEVADRGAQRHADVLAGVQRGPGGAHRHPGGQPRADPVGQAGQRVAARGRRPGTPARRAAR